jgi:hypothetical protein
LAKLVSCHGDDLWISVSAGQNRYADVTSGQAIATNGQASIPEEYATEDHVRCDFARLIEYLERRLGTDGELEVLEHLEGCEVCFDTICELVRERAAFRALRACEEAQIAAMRRAGTRHPGPVRGAATHLGPGFANDHPSDQIPPAQGLGKTSKNCIRKGRRWTRWG